jgi:hypothetical protein
MRFNAFILVLFSLATAAQGQVKYEREFRILREQFPKSALESVSPYLDGVKKLKFYKEIDSNRRSYELKFKKDRLHYSVEFNEEEALEDVEVIIKPVDIPEQTWNTIQEHLGSSWPKYKVRKIQQQYPRDAFSSDSETFQKAFQNLILPEIRYEIVVRGKTEDGYRDFELLYDAKGELLLMRESLPPNYDHVLY